MKTLKQEIFTKRPKYHIGDEVWRIVGEFPLPKKAVHEEITGVYIKRNNDNYYVRYQFRYEDYSNLATDESELYYTKEELLNSL